MPLSSYSELKASVSNWLSRDTDLDSYVDDFIDLAEAEFNRRLKTLAQEVAGDSITTVGGTQAYAYDTDAKQIKLLYYDDYPKGLEFRTEKWIQDRYGTSGKGKPVNYAISGTSVVFGPIPDGVYTIRTKIIEKVPALSVSNTTNWLLTSHPDLYLYRTLYHSQGFMQDDERLATWKTISDGILDDIELSDKIARETASVMAPRVTGYTP